MSNKKSILEQALLQVQTLEEAVKANAKGILSSTMKNELNGLLESMDKEEEEELKLPTEETQDVTEQPADEENPEDDNKTNDEDSDEEIPDEDSDEELPGDEFPSDDTTDEEIPGDETFDEPSDEDDTLDMTGASDEEVLKVFKAMKSEDGIVVKRDGNTVQFQDGDNDYIIKLDNETENTEDSDELENVAEQIEEEKGNEDIYEIELDDEDENDEDEECEMKEEDAPNKKNVKGNGNFKPKQAPEAKKAIEGEFTESARTLGFGYHGGIESKKVFKAGNKHGAASVSLNEEVEKLRKQNSEYKKALGLFKEKLNEVAVFNANLAYATRLFTECTTTKKEKMEILKRFDTVSTITESKNLYGSIKGEFDNKKPITETVVNKIVSTPQTSASKEVLAESKAYENPQFTRMRDLMNKIK